MTERPYAVPDEERVTIDVPKLSDIAHTGVRRAVLFMGLGLNAAHREDFHDYQLHKLPIIGGQTSPPIEFFPSDLPIDRVRVFKEEFAAWIISCGMRELIEHYALFLDQMHKYALLVLQTREKLGDINPPKAQARFNKQLGIPDKLVQLHNLFSIAPSDPESIKQLYQARNCLTHDLGIVTSRRCGPDGNFILTWRGLDFLAEGKDSGMVRPAIDLVDKQTKEKTTMFVRKVLRERKFTVGAKLVLSQQDLWEICFFFKTHAIPSAVGSFVQFLRKHEIAFDEGEAHSSSPPGRS